MVSITGDIGIKQGLSDDIDAKLSITSLEGTEIVVGFTYENMMSPHFDIHRTQLTTAI